jgi:hypothetical protein
MRGVTCPPLEIFGDQFLRVLISPLRMDLSYRIKMGEIGGIKSCPEATC